MLLQSSSVLGCPLTYSLLTSHITIGVVDTCFLVHFACPDSLEHAYRVASRSRRLSPTTPPDRPVNSLPFPLRSSDCGYLQLMIMPRTRRRSSRLVAKAAESPSSSKTQRLPGRLRVKPKPSRAKREVSPLEPRCHSRSRERPFSADAPEYPVVTPCSVGLDRSSPWNSTVVPYKAPTLLLRLTPCTTRLSRPTSRHLPPVTVDQARHEHPPTSPPARPALPTWPPGCLQPTPPSFRFPISGTEPSLPPAAPSVPGSLLESVTAPPSFTAFNSQCERD